MSREKLTGSLKHFEEKSSSDCERNLAENLTNDFMVDKSAMFKCSFIELKLY